MIAVTCVPSNVDVVEMVRSRKGVTSVSTVASAQITLFLDDTKRQDNG